MPTEKNLTAEEILTRTYLSRNEVLWNKSLALGQIAMEEYASQQSTSFIDWAYDQGYQVKFFNDKNEKVWVNKEGTKSFTTEELYQEFQK